jgi:hypothetical protein
MAINPTAFSLMSPAFQRGFLRAELNRTYPKIAGSNAAKQSGKMVALFNGKTPVGKCRRETLQLFLDAKLWKRRGKGWQAA